MKGKEKRAVKTDEPFTGTSTRRCSGGGACRRFPYRDRCGKPVRDGSLKPHRQPDSQAHRDLLLVRGDVMAGDLGVDLEYLG